MSDNLKMYFLLAFLVVWGAIIGCQLYVLYKHFAADKACRIGQGPDLPAEHYLPWENK